MQVERGGETQVSLAVHDSQNVVELMHRSMLDILFHPPALLSQQRSPRLMSSSLHKGTR